MGATSTDLERLAAACLAGDLSPFEGLGFSMDEARRLALIAALEKTNYHRTYEYRGQVFSLVDALGLLVEAATNEVGIAVGERARSLGLGKEVAVAFRHDGAVHFGVRYAANIPMTPGHLWSELKPWFKVLAKNRDRLVKWSATAKGVVSFPLAARVEAAGQDLGAELLAAIVAEPDDVPRRLVYADWLLERGDARGELIRLCEQHRAEGRRDETLKARISDLERLHRAHIAGDVAQLASDFDLDGGLVSSIVMAAPTFATHGARLLAQQPITTLELKPVDAKALARLAKAEAVRKLRGLRIGQTIGRERPMPFDAICAAQVFDALRELQVWTWETEGDPEPSFAGLVAPRLESLLLYQVDAAPRILAGLARNTSVRLRSLEIVRREPLTWPPAAFASEAFVGLERLRLEAYGRGGAELFARAHLPALRELVLECPGVDPDALAFARLRSLRIEACSADALGRLLSRHPSLRALRVGRIAAGELDRAYEVALALPMGHPLRALQLPTKGATEALVERARARFGASVYDPID